MDGSEFVLRVTNLFKECCDVYQSEQDSEAFETIEKFYGLVILIITTGLIVHPESSVKVTTVAHQIAYRAVIVKNAVITIGCINKQLMGN